MYICNVKVKGQSAEINYKKCENPQCMKVWSNNNWGTCITNEATFTVIMPHSSLPTLTANVAPLQCAAIRKF